MEVGSILNENKMVGILTWLFKKTTERIELADYLHSIDAEPDEPIAGGYVISPQFSHVKEEA